METDNELIAEFMGSKPYNDGRYGIMWPDPTDGNKVGFGLHYDMKWDWLMPVVAKIDKLHHDAFLSNEVFIEMIMAKKSPIDRHYMDVIAIPLSTPISEAHQAVVEFIKWYNAKTIASPGLEESDRPSGQDLGE